MLCVFAMWFDLQDYRGTFERNRDARAMVVIGRSVRLP